MVQKHSPIEMEPIMPLMASISRLYPADGGNMIARMSRYSDTSGRRTVKSELYYQQCKVVIFGEI
jgi:hypothetical protein